MAEQSESHPSPEQIRRGRRTALLLFVLGFGPILLATAMYYTGWLNPTGHSNNGILVEPPVPVAELNLETSAGSPLEHRFGPEVSEAEWLMLVVAGNCTEACQELMYLARQVNIALGKNADRVSRAAYVEQLPGDMAQSWDQEYSGMERLELTEGETADWPAGVEPARQPQILLVDPFGNIMMRYGTEHGGKAMLEDLKHLLKLSQIG
ncbi:MAG: hypothetical protein R3280_05935 [Marinobacter sp.]|uniref:hypothetical protein n=1 Tax=Marinobacter sp. TaxID=50741 RepID=UPI00299F0280|nr:hypothetical protein [Marinobacter sp.]MDX1634154.1 hypothetical protein [Marinobacter sp.]